VEGKLAYVAGAETATGGYLNFTLLLRNGKTGSGVDERSNHGGIHRGTTSSDLRREHAIVRFPREEKEILLSTGATLGPKKMINQRAERMAAPRLPWMFREGPNRQMVGEKHVARASGNLHLSGALDGGALLPPRGAMAAWASGTWKIAGLLGY